MAPTGKTEGMLDDAVVALSKGAPSIRIICTNHDQVRRLMGRLGDKLDAQGIEYKRRR